MNMNKAVTWLYEELPKLVASEVITDDTAERLKAHYGPVAVPARGRVARMLFSILGALLIGLGIILILAHNWDDLSRPIRAVLSFTPLIIGQALVAWTLLRRTESLAWREGSATFLTLSIGASIALISQTYNLGGRLDSFLLTWLLLGFPLIYFMNASTVAILFLFGLTSWAAAARFDNGNMLFFWFMIPLVVPHIWLAYRHNPEGPRVNILSRSICVALPIATGFVLEGAISGLWILIYSAMFSGMFLLGRNVFQTDRRNVFRILGYVGSAVMALILTFKDVWRDVGWSRHYYSANHHVWGPWQDGAIALIFMGLVVPLAVRGVQRKDWATVLVVVLPVLALLGFAASASEMPPEVMMTVFNLYVLVYGIATLLAGLHRYELLTVNAGMGVVSALILTRFFDSNLSFTLRGILFILLGIAFLVANLMMVRRIAARKEISS